MTLNPQKPGIEWTHVFGEGSGYTWNPVQGCQHKCKWVMPDGATAICYAETIANKFRSDKFMPLGFEHHYWNPDRLEEPLKKKQPSGIFLDSVSDLMGAWVPDDHIRAVLDVVRRADWHEFQLLTKNAPRLLKFADEFPPNLWVGVSMPPSQMLGHDLNSHGQQLYMRKTLQTLRSLHHSSRAEVLWLSLEPLSFDVAPLLDLYGAGEYLNWLVIGAASNGRTTHQPDPAHVRDVLDFARWARNTEIPVFMKGNLEWEPRREEFPTGGGA